MNAIDLLKAAIHHSPTTSYPASETIPGWLHVGNSSQDLPQDAVREYAPLYPRHYFRTQPYFHGKSTWAIYVRAK